MSVQHTGKVYLVGAGPGAPDLLTLRAARLLAAADIVLHDALVHPQTLSLAVRAELVPVGKRCGAHSTAQRFINKRLVDAATKHALVVRLKGGDPMLFGRAQEEIDALTAAGIEFEIVPGITAALAASAQLGVSLTQRGVARTMTFVTPRIGDEQGASDWAGAVLAADTAAIYMGAGQATAIAATLIARGCPAGTPVAVVRDASLTGTSTRAGILSGLAALCAAETPAGTTPGPAVILLGEALRGALACGALEEHFERGSVRQLRRQLAG
ncbi:MAG: uroporphyrinogen-III C-methyltransferase [Betaproteobacteria bacterium]